MIRSGLKAGQGIYFDSDSNVLVDTPRFHRAFEIALRVRRNQLDGPPGRPGPTSGPRRSGAARRPPSWAARGWWARWPTGWRRPPRACGAPPSCPRKHLGVVRRHVLRDPGATPDPRQEGAGLGADRDDDARSGAPDRRAEDPGRIPGAAGRAGRPVDRGAAAFPRRRACARAVARGRASHHRDRRAQAEQLRGGGRQQRARQRARRRQGHPPGARQDAARILELRARR